MAKRSVSADINRPLSVTVTGLGGGGGGGGGAGTLPGTITPTTDNTITGSRHTHRMLPTHAALPDIGPADHHDPVTVGNTGLSVSGQQVSLRLATVSGLEISSGLRLADSIAGDGLSIASKVLGIDLATNSGLQLSGSPAKLHLRTPSSLDATTANTVTDVLGHTHKVTTGSARGLSASTVNAEGTGAALARADHGHAITAYSDLATYPGQLAKADASGDSTWHRIDLTDRLRASLIDSASGQGLIIAPDEDLSLSPVSGVVKATSGVAIGSDHYVSQMTGWRTGYDGGADFRYLYADELHAKSFITDLEQALAGGQIIAKSVAVVAEDFTVPAAGSAETLVVEDLPGANGQAVFQDGDMVRLRQFTRGSGSLTIADCWGVVTAYSDNGDGTQDWTFTRSSGVAGGTAAGTIAAKTLALDYGVSGNGFYEVNAIDGAWAQNSPYAQVVTWTTHPQSGQVVRSRWGNLRGIFAAGDDFGLYAAVDGHTDADQYLRISSQGARLNNLPLEMYSGGDKVLALDPTAPDIALGNPIPTGWLSESGFWTGRHTDGSYRAYIGTVSGGALAAGWQWDGSTLTVRGTIVVQAGSSGISNLSDAGALATKNSVDLATGEVTNKNLDNVADGSTYKRVTANEKTGAARGYSGLDSNAYVSRVIRGAAIAGGSAATGLNLTADYLGYYDGSSFRTYLDKNGNFLFSKAGGASLLWSASAGKLQGRDASSNVQWETDATTGAIVAGAGGVSLGATGLQISGAETSENSYNRVTWFDTTHIVSKLSSGLFYSSFPDILLASNPDRYYAAARTRLEANVDATHYSKEALIATKDDCYWLAEVKRGTTQFVSVEAIASADDEGGRQVYIAADGKAMLVATKMGTAHYVSIPGGLNIGTATGAGTGSIKASGGLNVGTATGARAGNIVMANSGAGNTLLSVRDVNAAFAERANIGHWDGNGGLFNLWDDAGNNTVKIRGYASGGVQGWLNAGRILIGTTSDDGVNLLQVNGSVKAIYAEMNWLQILDGIAAPATVAGLARIYVDSADGDLKIKFGNGTVKTIVTD